MASDPTLHTALLERFGDILVRGLNDYLQSAVTRGEVRHDVTATELAEAIARNDVAGLAHSRRERRRRMGRAHRPADHERNQFMTIESHEATDAWRELLDTLRGLDESFMAGPKAVTDDRHVADGYRMIATTLGVALDTYLFADPTRPRWLELDSRPPGSAVGR